MNNTSNDRLRALPSVDSLISSAGGAALAEQYGRAAALEALRSTLDAARSRLREGEPSDADPGALLDEAAAALHRSFRPSLRPVINATGIILHTNLGRAPLSEAAQQAMIGVAAGYSTLEFDLERGKRGSRLAHPEAALVAVTGAEAALVVNNNAAALLLILSAFAQGKEVITSRGQLVEIGGGFRVPEVLRQSGATLVEIGTTNRTRAADYERAISDQSAVILRTHASNFKQIGFVESAPLKTLAKIAHAHDLLLVDDLGSGTLIDTARYGLDHEPMAQESLAAGVDLVSFSGDKLLGGPQAGIILGKKALIDTLKRHPLARAVRADKLCLAALVATLDHYRKGEAVEQIPVWRMIARPLAELQALAAEWAAAVGGTVIAGELAVGGGSLPGATLPTALVALEVGDADGFHREAAGGRPAGDRADRRGAGADRPAHGAARSSAKCDHRLLDIILLAICAVLCRAETWEEIELFGDSKAEWLKQWLELPNGIPSHDTIERVFNKLDPQAFQARFQAWVQAVFSVTEGQVVAIDGKTVCGAGGSRGKSNLHLVSAWASANGITLGQMKVNSKSNEITAIPELLQLLVLKGCIVTLDAMGCQTAIAEQIVAQKADYVLSVKQNQGHLYQHLESMFALAEDSRFPDIQAQTAETVEQGHGRREVRRCEVLTDTLRSSLAGSAVKRWCVSSANGRPRIN